MEDVDFVEQKKPLGPRPKLIQSILDQFDRPAYLEIGVNRGETFFAVNAERKVAVDPRFLFDYKKAESEQPGTQFHQTTSDIFFSKNVEIFDVIFLDGLHTFDQTLRDLLNASEFLKFRGVIVIDDMLPTNFASSLPDHTKSIKARQAMQLSTKEWMGDVYRLAYFIESYCQQFAFRSVGSRGVIWKQSRSAKSVGLRSVKAVSELGYDAVLLEPECYHRRPLEKLIAELQAR